MEALEQEKIKESRTEKLLRTLKMPSEGFVDPALPSKVFSYSQYSSYKICGKAYEFSYVLREPRPAYAPMVRGVSVHAGLEFMLRRKMAGQDVLLEEAIAVAESRFEAGAQEVVSWGPDEDGEATQPEKILDEVRNLTRVFYEEGLPLTNPVGIEEGFAHKFGDVPMIGYIDLVDLQPAIDITGMSGVQAALAPKKTVIVDFKSTKKSWGANQIRGNPQMTLYAAVKGTPHVRIDQLVTTKKVKYVRSETERTPQDVDILVEDLNETVALIKKGVFAKCAVDSWSCNAKHCSFWDKCRGKQRNPLT